MLEVKAKKEIAAGAWVDDSEEWIEEIQPEPPRHVLPVQKSDGINQLESLISDNG